MVAIRLKGWAANNNSPEDEVDQGPEVIFKDIDLPAVPRIGEQLHFSFDIPLEPLEKGTLSIQENYVVEDVWYILHEQIVEVHFRDVRKNLKYYVDGFGFQVDN